MLVSRNVFHVVSFLYKQSNTVLIHFLADQISCRSYVGSVYRMRSLAVSHLTIKIAFLKKNGERGGVCRRERENEWVAEAIIGDKDRKGPGKRGHIVADTNVSPFARARNMCCGHKICVPDTKKCLMLFRNILCPPQMFPSLRSPRNIMGNNVSATMCPRLPGP